MAEVRRKRNGDTYIIYSDQEIEDSKNISVVDFLEKEYGWSFKRVGRYYQCRQHDSLMIKDDCRSWYWNSQISLSGRCMKGRNVYDWLTQVENMSFYESMQKIIGVPAGTVENIKTKQTSFAKAPPLSEIPIDEVKEIELPERFEGKMSRIFAYLVKARRIDSYIVDDLVKNKLIYEDTYHNVVFVGHDENNEIKFAEAKMTNTFLANAVDEKGKKIFHPRNVSGSDKRYGFNIPVDKERYPQSAGILYVFEAPIDLLSHCTFAIMNEKERARIHGDSPDLNIWRNVNRLSLSGVSSVALESYLERNPDIHKIVFALDFDERGRKAAIQMEEKFTELGYSCTKIRPHSGKDFNGYLQMVCTQKELGYYHSENNQQSINNSEKKKAVVGNNSVKR